MLDIVGEQERANVGIYISRCTSISVLFYSIFDLKSIAACMFTNQDDNEKY